MTIRQSESVKTYLENGERFTVKVLHQRRREACGERAKGHTFRQRAFSEMAGFGAVWTKVCKDCGASGR